MRGIRRLSHCQSGLHLYQKCAFCVVASDTIKLCDTVPKNAFPPIARGGIKIWERTKVSFSFESCDQENELSAAKRGIGKCREVRALSIKEAISSTESTFRFLEKVSMRLFLIAEIFGSKKLAVSGCSLLLTITSSWWADVGTVFLSNRLFTFVK